MDICCCNTVQLSAIIAITSTTLISIILWSTVLFAPVKLTSVFLHEISHAIANILTKGKVKGISINDHFGGVTLTQGGNRPFTLCAGYTGSVIWGCLFLLLSVQETAAYIGCGIYGVMVLLAALILEISGKSWLRSCGSGKALLLRIAMIVLAGIAAACMAFDILTEFDVSASSLYLQISGTLSCLYATADTIHDTFIHKVDKKEKSDAVMLSEEYCLPARCWGLIWTIQSLLCLALTMFLIIYIERDDPCDKA